MSRRDKREQLTPELTPLIDVVFLLLIFFLVSSVFKKEELALLLQLPKAQQGKGNQTKQKELTIELSKEKLAVDGKAVEMTALGDNLKDRPKSTLINLRVDGKVVYDRLIEVLDTLQKYKLENVNLITEKKTR